MNHKNNKKINRRDFLKQSSLAAATLATGLTIEQIYANNTKKINTKKKVIVLGIDGMDPRLSERLMDAGMLPNFKKLREAGGYSPLGTSIPPQSPVAWANFITGADSGTHGIFDFVHRQPENPRNTRSSISHVQKGTGFALGKHVLFLRSPKRVLGRQGVPFWDYLDEAGINSTFYNLPSNYPPSESKYGNHRCLSGMGTPDLLGTKGTYQYFTEDGP
ncbi:MAG: alkaline phosphatase family protein, partial [Planctomycetota bacterium]